MKITEPDERRAVQRFLDWKAKNAPTPMMIIESTRELVLMP